MILTVASFKGGVGKTTTAIHLASYFSRKAPTVLIDGDPNRSSSTWAARGNPKFHVAGEHQIAMYARKCEHLIIDTKARPEPQDLKALADGCDLLILPCTPDPFSLDALLMTIEALRQLGNKDYRILLTIVPPKPMTDGDNARQTLVNAGLPVFKGEIRRTVAFQRAALDGVTVDEVVKGGDIATQAWSDYVAIGKEIEQRNG
ncbi:chromosome partitioning protein ParA (plasmid) [Bryobacterales bacterium F-183]|nr:chromosome partitioning protein ParA [Bryobacterales bacterium F-183]